ncbi:MAG: hypothetical protein LKJ25_08710 [Clostridia bacterium]|jgi:hypothetical protein|nr:hypothetical protein [Clostridia bacterium]
MNKIVESFLDVDVSNLSFPNITIYFHPDDMPKKAVARLFEFERPTNICIVKDTIKQCRDDIKKSGFYWVCPRDNKDDSCIVETWFI